MHEKSGRHAFAQRCQFGWKETTFKRLQELFVPAEDSLKSLQ